VQKATQIFFLNGIAGAGKTEAVMSIVKTMLGSNNILVSGPNTN
jgi:tRNA A37 threonylcarbamoyladenosine biosynthesis protein TsaE